MEMIFEVLHFTFMGLLGGLLYVLIRARRWKDLYKFESIRHMLVSIIVGYIYSILYTEYDFPNSIMALVSGYMGTDFIKAIIDRFKPASRQ